MVKSNLSILGSIISIVFKIAPASAASNTSWLPGLTVDLTAYASLHFHAKMFQISAYFANIQYCLNIARLFIMNEGIFINNVLGKDLFYLYTKLQTC